MKKVDEMPVVAQRQIPMVQTVQETTEISQLECIDKVVDDFVVQVPQIQVVEKTVEGQKLQIVGQFVETPETQMIQSARTSERSGPAESASPIFVTAPVLENSPVVVGSAQPAHVAENMALAPARPCADAAVTHATRLLPATTMAVAHRLVDEKPADDMVSCIFESCSEFWSARRGPPKRRRRLRPEDSTAWNGRGTKRARQSAKRPWRRL